MSQQVRAKQVSLTLPEPHPKQRELIEAHKDYPSVRFVVGACGTKFGKTYGCSICIVEKAWLNQDPTTGRPLPGPGRYWWVAPSYAQTKIAMELVKNLLPHGTYIEYRADMRLVLIKPDGSEHAYIEFKSGDNPDTLRGYGVHFFIIDEAARIPYESFVSVMTTVTQTGGKGIIISTPNGRGWFYDVYQRGEKYWDDGTPKYVDEEDNWKDWMAIRMPTWTNPTVPIEFVAQAKKNLPIAVFQQEYGAKFLEESAGVFNNIDGCIAGELEPPKVGHRYVMGVDLARLHDYTVIIVMDVTQGRNQVVYFNRVNELKWQIQYRRIKEVCQTYFNARICMDWTGIGDPIVETLHEAGLPIEPYKIGGSAAKQNLIEKLRVCLEHRRITYPRIPVMIEELRNYEYEHTPSGVVKYSAPSGQHDDCVIALALVCMLADAEPWVYRFRQVRV